MPLYHHNKIKQTKTESKEWGKFLGKETSKMKTGNEDISWIYEFLGWKKMPEEPKIFGIEISYEKNIFFI